jgi:hypothetical protein
MRVLPADQPRIHAVVSNKPHDFSLINVKLCLGFVLTNLCRVG